MKDPLSLLGKATLGTFRSSSFLSAFVLIYQGEPDSLGHPRRTPR